MTEHQHANGLSNIILEWLGLFEGREMGRQKVNEPIRSRLHHFWRWHTQPIQGERRAWKQRLRRMLNESHAHQHQR